jgi:hypothetical protein
LTRTLLSDFIAGPFCNRGCACIEGQLPSTRGARGLRWFSRPCLGQDLCDGHKLESSCTEQDPRASPHGCSVHPPPLPEGWPLSREHLSVWLTCPVRVDSFLPYLQGLFIVSVFPSCSTKGGPWPMGHWCTGRLPPGLRLDCHCCCCLASCIFDQQAPTSQKHWTTHHVLAGCTRRAHLHVGVCAPLAKVDLARGPSTGGLGGVNSGLALQTWPPVPQPWPHARAVYCNPL